MLRQSGILSNGWPFHPLTCDQAVELAVELGIPAEDDGMGGLAFIATPEKIKSMQSRIKAGWKSAAERDALSRN